MSRAFMSKSRVISRALINPAGNEFGAMLSIQRKE
jgi:hypothetical protein